MFSRVHEQQSMMVLMNMVYSIYKRRVLSRSLAGM